MENTYDYDLIDDGGVCSLEDIPMKLKIGSIFECEYGTYQVIKPPKEAINEGYNRIMCERVETQNNG